MPKLYEIIEKRVQNDPTYTSDEVKTKMSMYLAKWHKYKDNPEFIKYLEYEHAYSINQIIVDDINEHLTELRSEKMRETNSNRIATLSRVIDDVEKRKDTYINGTYDTQKDRYLVEPLHQLKSTFINLKKQFE
jgi:hypothetical protein